MLLFLAGDKVLQPSSRDQFCAGKTILMYTTPPNVPTGPILLGAAGALPFIAAFVATPLLGEAMHDIAGKVLVVYAALILSFLGGIQWGLAMAEYGGEGGRTDRYAVSILPVLIAWSALLAPTSVGYWILAAGFLWALVTDILALRAGFAPPWYRRIRIPLSIVVVACSVVGALTF